MPEAICIRRTGGPEVLEREALEPGRPGPGEALVRHTAIGLNFIDTYHRSGLYPVELPAVLGVEAAGVVEELGEGVDGLGVGDRVAYAGGGPGAYATHRRLPAERLLRLPPGLDDRTAAASLLKGLTAEYLVRRTWRPAAGETVLVHAAAGATGSIVCQWARHLGLRVLGTVGSAGKRAAAEGNGCEHVLVLGDGPFAVAVRELTGGEGVAVVFDGVGAATWEGSLDSLRRRGLMVSFGNASGPVPPLAPLELSRRGSLYLTRPTLWDYVATRGELETAAAALFEVLESGAVRVEIGQTYPLVEAARAHRDLEGRRTVGATVLLP